MDYRKPLSLAAALGFAASLACGPVLAQQQMPEQEEPKVEELGQIDFEQIDQNGDGQVTKEEFLQRGSEQMFEQADQNGDGVLTEQELESAKQQEEEQKQQQQQQE